MRILWLIGSVILLLVSCVNKENYIQKERLFSVPEGKVCILGNIQLYPIKAIIKTEDGRVLNFKVGDIFVAFPTGVESYYFESETKKEFREVLVCGEIKKDPVAYIDAEIFKPVNFYEVSYPEILIEGEKFELLITIENKFNSVLKDINVSIERCCFTSYSKKISLLPGERKTLKFELIAAEPSDIGEVIELVINSPFTGNAKISVNDRIVLRSLSKEAKKCGIHSVDLIIDGKGNDSYGETKLGEAHGGQVSEKIAKEGNVSFEIILENQGDCDDNFTLWLRKGPIIHGVIPCNYTLIDLDENKTINSWEFEVFLKRRSSRRYRLVVYNVAYDTTIEIGARSHRTSAMDYVIASIKKSLK